ncbi:MAG: cbb3-type cytochrome oxidase assembly protein CcoS [SAR324 cluster bacterium]
MGLEALVLLIPASVLLAAVALALFLWAMLTGQFDDLETPPLRMLFEEESAPDGNVRGAAGQARGDALPPAEEQAAQSAMPPPADIPGRRGL